MYVRKFESETIDGALKAIKQEFGPDAIILKTVTNSGLKGALMKNKVEVTAAISERNYTKKSRVDVVLDDDTKKEFYENNSSYISEMINAHSDNRSEQSEGKRFETSNPYGGAGLNRPVQSVQSKATSALDEFLSGPDTTRLASEKPIAQNIAKPRVNTQTFEEAMSVSTQAVQVSEAPIERVEKKEIVNVNEYEEKISLLEKKLFELTKTVERQRIHEPQGLYSLRSTLRSLKITDHFTNEIIKKATFELSREELEDYDVVFEFCLREMLSTVEVAMPSFSKVDEAKASTVTLLLSEGSCGQTSSLVKLGHMTKNSVLVQYGDERKDHIATKFLGIKIEKVSTFAEVVSNIRKGVEQGKHIFVDFKNIHQDIVETKKFVDGVKRSFAKVEVLICLSSIHSETYNKRVVNRYQNMADGMIVNHLDQCLDYGSLFNISYEYKSMPLTFFGTGEVIPDDIELASGERVLSGMFKLN